MVRNVLYMGTVRSQVAEEVRAAMGRRRVNASTLAAAIGMSTSTMSLRLKGTVAFDVDELQRVAECLDVDVDSLFPRIHAGAERAA